MSYFKVLRWSGGEGGDALLYALLISNAFLKTNVILEKSFLNPQGRVTIPNAENLNPNLNYIVNNPAKVDSLQLQKEFEKLKNEGNWIIKSHYYEYSEDTITILPSEKTFPFFFAARYLKIPLRNIANTEEKMKLLIKDKEFFIEYDKKILIDFFNKKYFKDYIFIDDILSKNYDVLENKLNLSINTEGRNFIDSWFETQKQLFPKELVDFN